MLCIKLKLIIFCCKIYFPCFILLFTLHVHCTMQLYTMKLVFYRFSVLYVNKSIKQGKYILQQKINTYNFFTIKENKKKHICNTILLSDTDPYQGGKLCGFSGFGSG